jgi:hypothetical protein
MIGHALLAVLAVTAHADWPATAGMIALTCNEIRRLFNVLIIEPAHAFVRPLAWSSWRRRHNITPVSITTSANRQSSRGHNDLQLEY